MAFLKIGGLTKGVVVDTNDPAGFNRVKVRILQIHGAVSKEVYIKSGEDAAKRNRVEDEALPWCEVCHAYGSDNLPQVDQVVLLGFIGGDQSQPVVLGWAT